MVCCSTARSCRVGIGSNLLSSWCTLCGGVASCSMQLLHSRVAANRLLSCVQLLLPCSYQT
jgi:hypothetical protein